MGSFRFKLCYPELRGEGGGHCNEWEQTSNPAVDTSITGFNSVSLAFKLDSYGGPSIGLGRNGIARKDSFIDAIGATKYYGGADTIPGPYPNVVKRVELYVFNEGNCLDDNIMLYECTK